MPRRSAMTMLAGAAVTACSPDSRAEDSPQERTGMGLVIYDCNLRRRWMRQSQANFDLFEPLTFLRHCHALGAGGMQANLGVMTPADIESLRRFAGQHDLFIDAIIRPPTDRDDLSRFEAEVLTARDVGVQAARTTIIPGRRYERFSTLAEFRDFERRGQRRLELAVPILEKHQVRFAVENHKDQRIAERVSLFEHLQSEFVGACIDTGNSFALLDGAYEPIEELAPYAMTVHLKDQALQPYDDGFLLGDIPLGQGSFDLKRMVATIRKSRPKVRFALELITRDALKVPCLTDQYFATMPEVPAIELAQTMNFVHAHTADHLQDVSTLSQQEQVALEDANVMASIQYAGKQLGL